MAEHVLPARVLIVDDDEDFSLALKRQLETGFEQVDVAKDEATAMESLGRGRYDLLILDLMLGYEPGGLELCRRLKADPAWHEMPVMVLSSADVQYGLSIKSYLDEEGCLPADDFVDKGATDLDDVVRRARVLVERLAP